MNFSLLRARAISSVSAGLGHVSSLTSCNVQSCNFFHVINSPLALLDAQSDSRTRGSVPFIADIHPHVGCLHCFSSLETKWIRGILSLCALAQWRLSGEAAAAAAAEMKMLWLLQIPTAIYRKCHILTKMQHQPFVDMIGNAALRSSVSLVMVSPLNCTCALIWARCTISCPTWWRTRPRRPTSCQSSSTCCSSGTTITSGNRHFILWHAAHFIFLWPLCLDFFFSCWEPGWKLVE